jgi:hypothetical protein
LSASHAYVQCDSYEPSLHDLIEHHRTVAQQHAAVIRRADQTDVTPIRYNLPLRNPTKMPATDLEVSSRVVLKCPGN